MFDWDDLRIFLAVARSGSTLAAAKILNINQTTAGRRINALEHSLGMSLFQRDTRGSTLSPQAVWLVEHAEAVEAAVLAVATEADRLRRDITSVIRITAPEAIMAEFVGPLTLKFRSRYPGIRFDYLSNEHRLNLEAGEADIAFRAGGTLLGDTLVQVSLPTIPWSVYCTKSYRDNFGMPESLADLRPHHVISYGPPVAQLPAIVVFMANVDPQKIVGTSNAVPNMCGMIRAGVGLGMLPCFVGNKFPDLLCCFPPTAEMQTPWWLVTARRAYQNPRVRDLMTFAAKEIRRNRALIQGQRPAPDKGRGTGPQ